MVDVDKSWEEAAVIAISKLPARDIEFLLLTVEKAQRALFNFGINLESKFVKLIISTGIVGNDCDIDKLKLITVNVVYKAYLVRQDRRRDEALVRAGKEPYKEAENVEIL